MHKSVGFSSSSVASVGLSSAVPSDRRAIRYQRARSLASLLRDRALSACHHARTSASGFVRINAKHSEHRSGFFTGLQSCGKAWVCPHCQPRIAARRAHELRTAIDRWKAEGGSVLLVTFTLSHCIANSLAETLGALKSASQKLVRHRSWSALRHSVGLVGRVVSTEITYGSNGWHPHLHQLWFVSSIVDLNDIQETLSHVWRVSLQSSNFTASDAHGVRVDGGEYASEYISKMGRPENGRWTLADEMSKTGSKLGRNGSKSIWQILDDFRNKSFSKKERFHSAHLLIEYANATFGVNSLKWSPGLKARFNIAERSDLDLAKEQFSELCYQITEISPDDWPFVSRNRAQSTVLTAAEDAGANGVSLLLKELRQK